MTYLQLFVLVPSAYQFCTATSIDKPRLIIFQPFRLNRSAVFVYTH